MEEKKDEGFTVRDRRTASAGAQAGPEQPKPPEGPTTEQRRETGPLPPIDFSSFILSLAATARIGLGLAPNPHTNLTGKDLPAAKQMIDLLGMLKEKTKGNLGQEEQTLLEQLLADLRMLYVKVLSGNK